jgi:Domain of unknown function (DUF4010)
MTTSDIVRLLIATLGGAAVGLERQWSGHAEGPAGRFAGLRTFTMLGTLGGCSGWLWTAASQRQPQSFSPEPSCHRCPHGWPYLAAPALLATLVAVVGVLRSTPDGAPDVSLDNPLQLDGALHGPSISSGADGCVHRPSMVGASGVLTSAAVLGLTDVDALTVSMARGVAQTVSPTIAATAIAVGVLANTAMKLGLTLFLGRRSSLTLIALGAALAIPALLKT